MSKRIKFQRSPVVRAVVAMSAMMAVTVPQLASAGAGWGDTTNPANTNGKMQTFYANSPAGIYNAAACFDAAGNAATPVANGLCDSGTALKKFVDTLPGLNAAGANNLGNYIPTAIADTTSFSDADYYEIAVVEYSQQMHTSLPATKLRGYVQIDPLATDTAASISRPANLPAAQSPAGSKKVALFNLDGSAAMISRPDSTSATGFKLVQAYGVDTPHYLGPIITATQGRPTRLTFYDALPVGRADAAGRHGDLFLPVDETLPGAGFGPEGLVKYTQNRALIHLHGGDNPWISDGGPHQWITPAGELDGTNPASVTAQAVAAGVSALPFQRGPGAVNVPDMADPGPGAMTYYYPNGMSSRMEWYHDHTFGLTRLNVYAGEASAYIVRDAKEAVMTAAGGVLAGLPELPLVLQDKTFVPKNIAQQDGKWDTKAWGTYGDVWYPHVYEINQDPNSADATNPVGRWDWGPFFWPVFPSALDLPTGEHLIYGSADPMVGTMAPRASWTNTQTASTLDGPSLLGLTEVTVTPEAFNDTPIVNGVPYPTLTVEPKAYRLRFLNASNDRQMNLGFYVAAIDSTIDPLNPFAQPATGPVPGGAPALCDGTEATGSNCSEVRMVPFSSPNSPTATTFSCPASGWTPVSVGYPLSFPCTGGNMGTGWGSADNRPGGVPDPTTAGPNIHLMGNEAGFLAAPVDIPSTPVNYEYNKRSVTVLNVLEHGLFLSTAGRADTVVDFSAYAGKTLILYNDNPAPMPAGDPRLDYFTGVGDQTGAGGADNTMPGYGPNTRTVMQFKVLGTTAAAPFNFAALDAAITANVKAGQQEPPIVPQMAYSASFGTAAPYNTDTFGNIFTGAIYLGNYKPITFTTTTQTLYTPAPGSVTKCATPATCQAQLTAIKATGPVLVPAGTKISAYIESKTIQELFDATWGRMNATLGTELSFTNVNIATTIPLGYVDPATETLADGETQFWKITHNGVDSHPVHFHLVNVQLINRMGWDGTVKAPYPEDIGWKETIIMHPLEDVLVAVRSKKPVAPFALPHSWRANDPSQPLGVTSGFTQIDPVTGNPIVVANAMDDFLNEYVWHCHILGHEENDFMRPIKFDSKDVAPDAPTGVAVQAAPGGAEIKWTDPTPVGVATTPGNAKNEFGFRVERAPVTYSSTGATTGAFAGVGQIRSFPQAGGVVRSINTLANATVYDDTTLGAGDYAYRVVTVNAAGETPSAAVNFVGALLAPTNLHVTADTASSVSLAWTDNATNELGYLLSWTPVDANGVAGALATPLPMNSVAGTVPNLAANTTYAFTATAVNGTKSAASTPVNGTTAPVPVVINTTTGTFSAGAASLALSWTNGNPNLGKLTSVVVSGSVGGVAITPVTAQAGAAITNPGSVTLTGLTPAKAYALTVTVNGAGGSASTTVTGTTAGVVLNAATGVAAQLAGALSTTATPVALSWTDNSLGETGYQVQACFGTAAQCTATSTVSATVTNTPANAATWYKLSTFTYTAPTAITGAATATFGIGISNNNSTRSYFFRVLPLNGAVAGPASATTSINLGVNPAAPTAVSVYTPTTGATTPGTATVTWTDVANNNATYLVQYRQTGGVNTIALGNNPTGWVTAPKLIVSAPAAGGVTALATAVVTGGRLTITVTNPGAGYITRPTVTIDPANTGTWNSANRPNPTMTATGTLGNNTWLGAFTSAPAVAGNLTSASLSGLTAGVGYQVQVQAVAVNNGQSQSPAAVAAVPTSGGTVLVVK